MANTEGDKEFILLEMCEYFNALSQTKCDIPERHGSLKCHSIRESCPDYCPSKHFPQRKVSGFLSEKFLDAINKKDEETKLVRIETE